MSADEKPSHRWEGEQFRLLVENVKDYAIFVLDTGGHVQTWSLGGERLLGYTEAEILGAPFSRFFTDADIANDEPRKELEGALRTGRGLDDRWHVRKDGTLFWCSGVLTPLRDEQGELRGYAKIMRDLTQQKLHEDYRHESEQRHAAEKKLHDDALKSSEGRFRALMEQAPFSVQILSPDGSTVRVNNAWTERWGITLADLEGYNMLEDAQLEEKGALPYIRRAFAGEATRIPPIQYDPKRTLPGIAQEEGTRWVSAVAYPLKDDAGRVQQVVLVHDDITSRIQAENALRESEEKLRLLADTIPQLAWMARADGHIFWYNRRWYDYTGMSAEELEGWGWQSAHDPEVLPEVLALWKRSIDEGIPFEMVFPLRAADGTFRPFLTRVNPLRDKVGRLVCWFGTNTDISEMKRMEESLREADRRKDEFLAVLAHELRNPLAPIRNSLQILKLPGLDATTAQRSREIMERQVNNLVRLVDDLLDVSRVATGKIELRKEPLDLQSVVTRALEIVQPLIDYHASRVEVVPAEEPLVLDADPVRLAQVVSNLLTNAIRYSPAGARVKVSSRRESNTAVLHVKDEGAGIPADTLPRVFDAFFQGESPTTRSIGGLGIGLTLVRRLVEMHGGTVDAHSEGPGRGSEFIVRLPLGPAVLHAPRAVSSVAVETSMERHRLMVVDDNKDAADSLAELLRQQGHEVRVAHDGPTALDIAKEYLPALIFLDIGMPQMDGYEVARRIRNEPALARTVLAALTGWGQAEDRNRSGRAGFDHHLVKPAEMKALEDVLRNLARPQPAPH